jgi:NAD-dependent SIR2 family protein deacetylase
LLIGAGAGMGVDSGLPDFRGAHGFWRAYPPYAKLGLDFAALADPRWFRDDPELAWGFYGHRLGLYRRTRPHRGFRILRRWADCMPGGWFVYTSNVDGQFQRAGFDPDRVVEDHGAIDRMQCTGDCGVGVFPADGYTVRVDGATMRAVGPLPACPSCGALARPNILMFGDRDWDPSRADAQRSRLGKRPVEPYPLGGRPRQPHRNEARLTWNWCLANRSARPKRVTTCLYGCSSLPARRRAPLPIRALLGPRRVDGRLGPRSSPAGDADACRASTGCCPSSSRALPLPRRRSSPDRTRW